MLLLIGDIALFLLILLEGMVYLLYFLELALIQENSSSLLLAPFQFDLLDSPRQLTYYTHLTHPHLLPTPLDAPRSIVSAFIQVHRA